MGPVDMLPLAALFPDSVEQADLYSVFGKRVADERLARKISQQELAKLVGLSRASIANIEAGRQRVLLHQAVGLVQALRIQTISDILPLNVALAGDLKGKAKAVNISGSAVSRNEAATIAQIVENS
ncbi:hypothetical protein ATE72_22175 [Sphingopyxis sp. HXXIV]|nr:hypothetical protein ATE72_22175 [Sphingopyxis sp. HXXIV]